MKQIMLKRSLRIATILSSILLALSCDDKQSTDIDSVVDHAYPAVDVIINDSSHNIEVVYTEKELDGRSRTGHYKVESGCSERFILNESDNYGIYNSDTLKIVFSDEKEVVFFRNDRQELNPYNDLKGVLTDYDGKKFVKYEVLISDQMHDIAQ